MCRAPLATLLALTTLACHPVANSTLDASTAVESPVSTLQIETDNDSAFLAKADRIAALASDGQPHTIDLAYYIYGDDYTSSYLSTQLLAAAQNGTHIRLLVDAGYNHALRPYYQMLMANSGTTDGVPNLQVAYFRPTDPQVLADLEAWGFSPADAQALVDALLGFNTAAISAIVQRNQLASDPGVKAALAAAVSLFSPSPTDTAGLAATLPIVDALLTSAPATGLSAVALAKEELLAADDESLPLPHLDAWARTAKLLHYKLMIIDGKYVQSGGRNIEDPYQMTWTNPLRASDASEAWFMDTDFHLEDPTVAAAATATFDAFWACRDGAACVAGIPVVSEQANDSPALLATLEQRAAAYAAALPTPPTDVAAHLIDAPGAPVTFIENRMFVDPSSTATVFDEEPSGYHRAWVAALDAVTDQSPIVIQNAYLFLPTDLQLAIERALSRGSPVTLVTNSPSSSDLGFMARLARFQYAQLLQIPGARIVEYTTPQALHAKVALMGDTMIVGSCNADPRSEFLDAQDGLLIGASPVTLDGTAYTSAAAAYRARLLDQLTQMEAQGLASDVTLGELASERDALLASLSAGSGSAALAGATLDAALALFAASFELDATGQPTAAATSALATLQTVFFEL